MSTAESQNNQVPGLALLHIGWVTLGGWWGVGHSTSPGFYLSTNTVDKKKGRYSFFNIYLFIYFWLCWVFLSLRGLSLVAASGGHSSSRCAGLSLSRPLLLQRTGSRRRALFLVIHRMQDQVTL